MAVVRRCRMVEVARGGPDEAVHTCEASVSVAAEALARVGCRQARRERLLPGRSGCLW